MLSNFYKLSSTVICSEKNVPEKTVYVFKISFTYVICFFKSEITCLMPAMDNRRLEDVRGRCC